MSRIDIADTIVVRCIEKGTKTIQVIKIYEMDMKGIQRKSRKKMAK